MSVGSSIGMFSEARACNCIGRQNGEPLCPCRMRGVKVIDGRYVEVIDHGPVREVNDIGGRWIVASRGLTAKPTGE